jgi:hypothetical protein
VRYSVYFFFLSFIFIVKRLNVLLEKLMEKGVAHLKNVVALASSALIPKPKFWMGYHVKSCAQRSGVVK